MKDIDTLVIVGDSYCWGTGLKGANNRLTGLPSGMTYEKSVKLLISEYAMWPYHLKNNFGGIISNKYSLNYLNLSQPGCSNETIFRKTMKFISIDYKKYDIDLNKIFILVCWTGAHRREFYSDGAGICPGYWNMSPHWKVKVKWANSFVDSYSEYLHSDYHDSAREFAFQVAVQNTLENKKIKFSQLRSIKGGQSKRFLKDLDSSEINKDKFLNYNEQYKNLVHFSSPHHCSLDHEGHPSEEGHKLIATHLENIIFKND